MKKSIVTVIIAAAILAAVALTNQTNATQPRPQREILILQADQSLIISNWSGQIAAQFAWNYSEFFVVKSSGSSGAPVYPTYVYGDAHRVGRTNVIVPLAQTLADLRTEGWRLINVDSLGKTYTLEKP